MLTQWRFETTDDMPLLHFERAFSQRVAHDAQHRRLFERVATAAELERGCPIDVVVPRLPHGPWNKTLRTPTDEIMAKDHPEMAATLGQYGYRGVLAYDEDRIDPTQVHSELARVSDLSDPDIRQVEAAELQAFQEKRDITADMLHVGHYVLIGSDPDGTERHRVARHAFDDRVTVFDTVGFDVNTMHEAVALAEYATANELRRRCIENTMLKRATPGSLGASNPEVRAGLRRLALLASAVTVGLSRRAQEVVPFAVELRGGDRVISGRARA
jgi:hypothetical protein